MRTGIGLNFSRAGNLAGIKRELAGNSPDGGWWENLHIFVGNGEKWCFNGFLANYVNY